MVPLELEPISNASRQHPLLPLHDQANQHHSAEWKGFMSPPLTRELQTADNFWVKGKTCQISLTVWLLVDPPCPTPRKIYTAQIGAGGLLFLMTQS